MKEDSKISKASHAIGMDIKKCIQKWGRNYFVAYRNYYSAGENGDPDWDLLEANHLATSTKGRYGKTYHLSKRGITWLQQELNVTILMEKDNEERYQLDEEAIQEIEEIWSWIKYNDIFTELVDDDMDIAIHLSCDDLLSFLDWKCLDFEDEIDAKIAGNGVIVRFSELLMFKASAKQIWELRSDGMREAL